MVLRWGIVGCGDVTEVKSGPGFRLAKNSQLVAVMRRDGEKAKDYAEQIRRQKWWKKNGGKNTVYIYIIFGYSCWGGY